MKVLLVNGSGHAKGCTYTALEEVAGALEKTVLRRRSSKWVHSPSPDVSAAMPV